MELLHLDGSQADIINTLKSIPLLQLFDEAGIRKILGFSHIQKYEPGEAVILENEFDNKVYFLISGSVQVEKAGVTVRTLSRTGDIFGEMGVLQGIARTASVIAREETVCLATDVSFMDNLQNQDKAFFAAILYWIMAQTLSEKLKISTEMLVKATDELKKLKGEK